MSADVEFALAMARKVVAVERERDAARSERDAIDNDLSQANRVARRLAAELGRRVVTDAIDHLGNLEHEQRARKAVDALDGCEALQAWRAYAAPAWRTPGVEEVRAWPDVIPEAFPK